MEKKSLRSQRLSGKTTADYWNIFTAEAQRTRRGSLVESGRREVEGLREREREREGGMLD